MVSEPPHDAAQVRALLDGIEEGEVVYLDLCFPNHGGMCRATGSVRLDGDGRLTLPRVGDVHLVVRVAPGDPAGFPFNRAHCEYDIRGEDHSALRLRGFFVAQDWSVATARGLWMDPVRLSSLAVESAIARGAVGSLPVADVPTSPATAPPTAELARVPEGLRLTVRDAEGAVLGEWILPDAPAAADFWMLGELRSAVVQSEVRLAVGVSRELPFASISALLDAARDLGFSEVILLMPD